MLNYEDVYHFPSAQNYSVLYQLMCEREPRVNISHASVPIWTDHVKYIESKPHKLWFVAYAGKIPVGAMYLTKHDEIGTFVLREHLRKGYATEMTNHMKDITKGTLYANVAPKNIESQLYCEKLGFKLKQFVYELKRS